MKKIQSDRNRKHALQSKKTFNPNYINNVYYQGYLGGKNYMIKKSVTFKFETPETDFFAEEYKFKSIITFCFYILFG